MSIPTTPPAAPDDGTNKSADSLNHLSSAQVEQIATAPALPEKEDNSPRVPTPRVAAPLRERLFLPSTNLTISESARRIFRALAPMLVMFIHAGVIVEIALTGKNRVELRAVSPSMARSRFEDGGELWRDGTDNRGRKISRPCRCSEDNAKALLAAREAQELLPPITTLSRSPVLTVDGNGAPRILNYGYNPELDGVFVTQDVRPKTVPLQDAVDAILRLLKDYRFATPHDHARAIAALLTPSMVYGQLLPGAKIPLFIIEANHSQTGKGLFTELAASLHGEYPNIIVPRKGGVGGFDEDFNAALFKGCPIIVLDNLRGQLESMHIESFLTAPDGEFMARTVRCAPVPIDPRRYVIFATSNKFETTVDMENRAVRIAIQKQPKGHRFNKYGEELVAYVRAHPSFYLGCVHSIGEEWIRHGRPGTDEAGHTCRRWAQAMDWILKNIFEKHVSGRLMDYDHLPEAGPGLADELGFQAPDKQPGDQE